MRKEAPATPAQILWGNDGHAVHLETEEKKRPALSGPTKRNFTKYQQKQIVRESIFKCDRDTRGEEKSLHFHMLAKYAYENEVACSFTWERKGDIEGLYSPCYVSLFLSGYLLQFRQKE